MKQIMQLVILVTVVLVTSVSLSQHLSRRIVVGWDYYPDYGSADVVKFKLYWGNTERATNITHPSSPHPYTESKEIIGIQEVTSFFDVVPQQTVYCSITAVDEAGNESGFSNQVSVYISPWPSGKPLLTF